MNEVKTVKLNEEVLKSLQYLHSKFLELKKSKKNNKVIEISKLPCNKLKKYKKQQIFSNIVNFINSSYTVLNQSLNTNEQNTINIKNFNVEFIKVNIQEPDSINKKAVIPFHRDDYVNISRPVWTMIYILKKDKGIICNNLWYKIHGILINISIVPGECIIIPGNLWYGLDEVYGIGGIDILTIQFERIINTE